MSLYTGEHVHVYFQSCRTYRVRLGLIFRTMEVVIITLVNQSLRTTGQLLRYSSNIISLYHLQAIIHLFFS